MDNEAFQAWTVCWKINLLFYAPFSSALRCIICSQDYNYPVHSNRSDFWIRATECTAGHAQSTIEEAALESFDDIHPGVCSTCDQNYMLKVGQGNIICRREGCRRVVRVNRTMVMAQLASAQEVELMDSFDALLDKWKCYECEICGEEIRYEGNPVTALNPPTPQCDHDRKVCDQDLDNMLEKAIRGGRLGDVVCPDTECKKPLPLASVREHVSSETFQIYNRKLTENTYSKNPLFRWCCGCGRGQLHSTGEENPELICLACKKIQCFICRTIGCEHLRALATERYQTKAQRRLAAKNLFARPIHERIAEQGNKKTEQKKAETTKKCPNASCNVSIERKGGCAHVTCKSCKTEFCFACKVIWPAGNRLHLVGCPIGEITTVSRDALDTTGYAMGWDKDEGYDIRLDEDLWLLESYQ